MGRALAGYARGVPLETMGEALRGFTSFHLDNPGRFNVHDGHGFRVAVDQAHNSAAVRAIGAVVEPMRSQVGRTIGSSAFQVTAATRALARWARLRRAAGVAQGQVGLQRRPSVG
jgi:hypothetical protein